MLCKRVQLRPSEGGMGDALAPCMHLTPPDLRRTIASSAPWLLALAFGALAHAGALLRSEPRVQVVTVPVPPPVVHVVAPACPVEPAHQAHQGNGALAQDVSNTRPSVICLAEDFCLVDERALFEHLAGAVHFVPYVRDGETLGMKLHGIPSDGPLAAMGLRNGDLLTTVNGMRLDGMDRVRRGYEILRQSSSVELEIVRGDRTLKKCYGIT